ncbi:UDP-N-acetylmuramoylalanyl-D-glutamate--2,6-diaminopimelate ligase [Labilithrix luteola]|uniref:UDP-N-acetylmuramoyl-L-alanyl-D-glutamate--2,6-diaminopimelate ligase n=1 Tax=Labilithrix luteola TaxID=1391654 RepID=A0A0K1PXB2_9BACT|nr:UDP-N-acetylmuramoyl-L-alanyl-D-glutamate--2,6-diaminopimelate ligase [Labilithrix luteola]AKU98026.1 UDP-N-acetylmuramoylalanyl-D-glutamate--2,6-diaminopimelate ligase [Labilithrix luteola]
MTDERSPDSQLLEARTSDGLTLADLARELPSAVLHGDGSVRVFGVQHDSRRVLPGDLFVVRRGEKFDGRAFVPDAMARGAVALLVDKAGSEQAWPCPSIEVDDLAVAMAYAAAAVYGHPAFSLDVVGVTGTNGKTTTTHLVQTAIDGALGGPFCGVVGTVGHKYAGQVIPAAHTTPESDELARVLAIMKKRGATHVAMEVSSIALVLQRVKAVRFRVAAFTNLTQDHLDFHGSMDAYAAAKMELFTTMGPGLAVVNVSDPFGARIAATARCKVFRVAVRPGAPEAETADIAAISAEPTPSGTHLVARVLGRTIDLKTRLMGAHNVENILVALGIVAALELDVDRAAAALANEGGPPGRLERCDGPDDDIAVLVDYAHTPDALVNVLAGLRPEPGARLICVFGCGGDRDPKKRRPMGEAVGAGAHIAIVTSDNPRTESPEAIAVPVEEGVREQGMTKLEAADLATASRGYLVELDRKKAIELAVLGARPRDIVLVAGKGHEDYQIIGTTKRPFDDRAVSREALAARRAPKGIA